MRSSKLPILQTLVEDQMATKLLLPAGARNHLLISWRAASLAAAFFTAACLVSRTVEAANDHAATFVMKSATEAIAILSSKSVPEQDRRTQFRKLILKNFDAPAIGRLVVEPYWGKASPDQQYHFQSAFESALAKIYTERFFDYDGESLQIRGDRAGTPGTTIVQTTIATPTGSKTYDVDWVVTGAAGKEKFLDVVIDGVSTSRTTQQDYGSVLRTSNGNLDALTALLQAKEQ